MIIKCEDQDINDIYAIINDAAIAYKGIIPEDRWHHKSFYRPPDSKNPPATCDITLDKAGFVELAGFDHSFFGISSAEAFHVSNNIRLSMEIAFEALENANIPISKIKGSDMGVFVAAGMDEGYIKLLFADKGWGGLWLASGFFIHEACDGMEVLDAQHTNETKRSMRNWFVVWMAPFFFPSIYTFCFVMNPYKLLLQYLWRSKTGWSSFPWEQHFKT